jgi:hypothetical protein
VRRTIDIRFRRAGAVRRGVSRTRALRQHLYHGECVNGKEVRNHVASTNSSRSMLLTQSFPEARGCSFEGRLWLTQCRDCRHWFSEKKLARESRRRHSGEQTSVLLSPRRSSIPRDFSAIGGATPIANMSRWSLTLAWWRECLAPTPDPSPNDIWSRRSRALGIGRRGNLS